MSELCQQCGQLKYLCRNDDPDLEFDILEEDCRVKVIQHDYEEAERKAGGENYVAPVGTVLRIVPFLLSGGDPASVRESFYEREHSKNLERLADG
jgi:hypothetical protein